MDFQKLDLDKYQKISVVDLPTGMTLPFDPSEALFDCLLAFVQSEKQVDEAINNVKISTGKVRLIFIYPKGTSKRYSSQINRDGIVARIKKDERFRAPKLVSLDEDWTK